MKHLEIFHLIGVDPRELFISTISIEDWGETVRLHCLYDMEENKPFEIVFVQCREFLWDIYDKGVDLSKETLADVIGILFGTDAGRNQVIITTDLFEVHINYADLTINKDW